jgi:hypothetical protein
MSRKGNKLLSSISTFYLFLQVLHAVHLADMHRSHTYTRQMVVKSTAHCLFEIFHDIIGRGFVLAHSCLYTLFTRYKMNNSVLIRHIKNGGL